MELAIFAARVDFRWQRRDEVRVNVPAHGSFTQIRIVHATNHCAETKREKFPDEIARVNFPDRKDSAQTDLRQIFLAPAFEVFKEDVTERTGGYAA